MDKKRFPSGSYSPPITRFDSDPKMTKDALQQWQEAIKRLKQQPDEVEKRVANKSW